MKYKLTLTEPMLGTLSGNKEITEEFIISKHPEGMSQEESDAIPGIEESLEKSSTIFARDNGRIMIWDYMIKGFFKSACEQMINSGTVEQKELKKYRLTTYLYKKTIDKQIFINPRRIYLNLPEGSGVSFTERPLRGETMRGERICLARSETVPSGTSMEIEVIILAPALERFISEWFNYGALMGLGQWRSGGMGRFSWEELKSE